MFHVIYYVCPFFYGFFFLSSPRLPPLPMCQKKKKKAQKKGIKRLRRRGCLKKLKRFFYFNALNLKSKENRSRGPFFCSSLPHLAK